MSARSFYVLTIILFSINVLSAQNKTLVHIFCDKLQNVYVQDQDNRLFVLDKTGKLEKEISFNNPVSCIKSDLNHYFIKGESILSIQNLKPDYHPESKFGTILYINDDETISYINEQLIWSKPENDALCDIIDQPDKVRIYNDQAFVLSGRYLIQFCLDTITLVPTDITDFVKMENLILLSSSDSGLFAYQSGTVKQYYIPGIQFPEFIKRIEYENDLLWIISRDNTLHSYDPLRQIFRTHAENVTDFTLDRWGTLWYITGSEVKKYTGLKNDVLPWVSLKKMKVGDILVDSDQVVSIHPEDELNLDFEYRYSPAPDKLRLQYSLNDGAWEDTESELKLRISKPGYYSLKYRVSSDGLNFTPPKIVKFRVQQNLLLTYWPYLLAAVGMLVLLLLMSLLRNNRLQNKLKQDRDTLTLKLKVLESEQKLGQAQMSPHFLFNTLNAIKGLVAMDQKQKAKTALSEFARLMRYQLNYSGETSISLEQEVEFLKSYLALETLVRPYQFDYKLNMEADNANIAPMMVQPFVENVLVHAFNSKGTDQFISISFKSVPHYITVVIEDNGNGLSPKSINSQDHKSKATDIYIQRCQRMDKWKTRTHYLLEPRSDNGSEGMRCTLNLPKL